MAAHVSPGICDNGGVHAAALRFDLHIPQSQSLKAKRAAIRPILDGMRHRFRVSVAETDHQDQWQRAEVGVAVVAESHFMLDEVLGTVTLFVESAPDVEVLCAETTYLEA